MQHPNACPIPIQTRLPVSILSAAGDTHVPGIIQYSNDQLGKILETLMDLTTFIKNIHLEQEEVLVMGSGSGVITSLLV